MKLARSPEAIWADLVAEGVSERICVETIYQAIYAGVSHVKPNRMSPAAQATQATPPGPSRQQAPGIGEHRVAAQ